MKVGDAVKLKKAKAYQLALDELVGLVVEFVPATPGHSLSRDIVRVAWPTGCVDKAWRKSRELEVVSAHS